MTEQELTEKIIFYRKQMGLSQKELAKKCNLPQSTISTIEKNHYYPSMFSFFEICKGLNISPAQFLMSKHEKALGYTASEVQILAIWNTLNIETQNFILALLITIKNLQS